MQQKSRSIVEQPTFSAAEGTLPVEQVSGVDLSEGGMELPGQLNAHLRNLLHRSAVANYTAPAQVTPQPAAQPAESQIVQRLRAKYGAEYDVAAEWVRTSPLSALTFEQAVEARLKTTGVR